MASQRPSEARKQYLHGLPKDEQADVMRGAEERGVGLNDFVWLEMLAAQDAANKIEATSTEAAARIMAAAANIDQKAPAIAPETLAAIEAAAAKGGQAAVPAEQLKEMASDLRAIRGRVWSARAPSRWWMFGTFLAGLVVAFACAAILHFAGHRPQGQIWIASDGLARLSEVLACVLVLAAGITWWTTRK